MALQLPTRQDSEQGEFFVPDEGVYRLKLTKYDTPIQSNFKDKRTNEYGQRICLYYEVDDPEDEAHEYELTRWRNFDMDANREASMYHDLKALNGGEEPDKARLDDYLECHCQGTVKHTRKPSRNDPSRTLVFANIDAVMPLKRKKRRQADDEVDDEGDKVDFKELAGRKKSAFDVDDDE